MRRWHCALAAVAAVVLCARAEMSANDHNTKALELANGGNLAAALPHFEAAVELQPRNVDYLNNLGVTYMRLQRMQDAEARFVQCLRLVRDYNTCYENLEELVKFAGRTVEDALGGAAKPDRPPLVNTNPRGKLPRVHVRDLYAEENRAFAALTKPFILEGAMDNWTATAEWTDEFLMDTFRDTTVDFYPLNMPFADSHPHRTAFHTAWQELAEPTGKYGMPARGPPGVYVHLNLLVAQWERLKPYMAGLPLIFRQDDFWIEQCLPRPVRSDFQWKTHWRIILIGNEGVGMFNHKDVLRTASWHATVRGVKRWHVCSPDQGPLLYESGGVDVFEPDYEKYPNFRHARCTEDDVREGEIIFYPRDYYHQTRNMETLTMTITSTVTDQMNHDTVAQELAAECYKNKYKWQFSDELCRNLEYCFDLWKASWGTDPKVGPPAFLKEGGYSVLPKRPATRAPGVPQEAVPRPPARAQTAASNAEADDVEDDESDEDDDDNEEWS